MARYNLYMFGRHAVCPICAGTVISNVPGTHYTCKDCCTRFNIIDEGLTDNELVCETVENNI